MPEWLNGTVLKTVMGREAHLGFESQPLRNSNTGEEFSRRFLSMGLGGRRDPAYHKKAEGAGESLPLRCFYLKRKTLNSKEEGFA